MTPDELAALHARCFLSPRPWSAAEFAAIAAQPGAFVIERPGALLVGRAVLDEAELLTLATAPEARRRGLGAALVAAFAETARQRGAIRAFLEVAADNAPALALYRRAGWTDAGRRREYYGPGRDALVMNLRLQAKPLP